MQLRRFRGKELPDVMRQVREELGPDAVILHTEQARPRGPLPVGGAVAVEVVAALDPARGVWRPARPPSATLRAPARGEGHHAPVRQAGAAPPVRAPRRPPRTVEDQLAELRELIVRLGGVRLLTPELVGLWERLVGAGVDESVAHAVLHALPRVDDDGRPLSPDGLPQALEDLLVSMVPIAPPVVRDPPPVVALVGPPGAGKTTTLAKLAARARIAGVAVGIASVTDGPLGAPSPLETFAPVIGAAYEFAPTVEDLAPVVADPDRAGPVLIDTPGLAAGDETGRRELAGLLRVVAPTRVHLVLSATAKAVDALAAIRAWGPLGVTDLVWTHLDETQSHGTVLGVSLEGGVPLSWLSAGADIPGDLEPASGTALVRRVLGAEVTA